MSDWQMLPYKIDPIFLKLGSLEIRYYGIMFMLSILVTYFLVLWRVKKNEGEGKITSLFVENLFLWCTLGIVIGGRLGYVLIYQPSYYFAHPLEILLPFQMVGGKLQFSGISGMSYHGGLLGMLVAAWFVARHAKIHFMKLVDFVVPAVPAGYTFGRLGNFLNGELWGRAADLPWAMMFPTDPEGLLRHPSQLYEAGLEGLLLFLLIWPLRNRIGRPGALFGLYLVGYGAVRFFIENFREPDAHLGLLAGGFSMGQWLCSSMVLIGVLFFALSRKESV